MIFSLPLLIAGVLLFSAWTFYPTMKLQYAQQRENQLLEAELAGLKTRNVQLKRQVERLKTPEGVEDAARESLGLVRPGENQYVVTGDETTSAEKQAAAPASNVPKTWWEGVLDAVFGFESGGGQP